MRARRGHDGFTLVEMVIVVAIIGVIAAIAIPALAQARQSASEAEAVGTMKAVYSAQALYKDRSGTGRYASSLALLAPIIDGRLASTGVRGGYVFQMVPDAQVDYRSSWAMAVWPVGGIYAGAGTNNFWIDDSGVIRFSKSAPGPSSPPLP